jgi:hypothetical protein
MKTFQLFRVLLLSAILVNPVSRSEARAEIFTVGRWKIEVTAYPDKDSIMLGEPTWISFEVANLSKDELGVWEGGDYRNALGRPESFSVLVMRADGKPVPQPSVLPGRGGLAGPRKLAAKSAYTFRLFLPHWATFEEPGTYSITCRRQLLITDSQEPTNFMPLITSTGNVAIAHTTLEVTPVDNQKMGRLISDLGTAMLENKSKNGESSTKLLACIDDERVVPYWRRAMAARSYSLRFAALSALVKFDSDEALEAIKAGMATTPADLTPPNTSPSEQAADGIRHAAAEALRKSRHPGALPFLLKQRTDPAESVRITVLHALGTMKPAEALPILREMAVDRSQRVSDEARRYIDLLLKNERAE